MALPRERWYPFWGDSNPATEPVMPHYWVHDDPRCRTVAALEGYPTLFLDKTGSNADSCCKACGQLLMKPSKVDHDQ